MRWIPELQEWLQAKKHTLPQYTVLKIDGKPHNQIFHVECTVPPYEEKVIGMANSRRTAEQDAADKMLTLIKNVE